MPINTIDTPPREIRFNAFAANGVVHQSPGLWAHPQDQSLRYTELEYWTELAQLLERGLFDAIFLADGTGINEVYGGGPEAALRHGAQLPRHDPFAVVPAMALVTKHLGFGVTSNLSNEGCVALARRFTSLDHLTRGRIAWNIVTGFRASSAKALGRTVNPREVRYQAADEFMSVAYQLWEGAWEDGAVLWDRQKSQFADPDKVHRVVHHGEHFDVDTLYTAVPSPQRTPLLFQAGTSSAGRNFASRHAECIFMNTPTLETTAEVVADVRARAVAAGRDARDVLFFPLLTVIVAPTAEEAQAKLADYRQYVNLDAALATYSAWIGVDLTGHDLDAPLRVERNATSVSGAIDSFAATPGQAAWTLREILLHSAIGGLGPVVVGDPVHVANVLQDWVARADVDGFNLSYALMPGDFAAVVDHLVPELQRRGAFKREYAVGTLREKIFGAAAGLPASHPAAAYRRPPVVAAETESLTELTTSP